MKTWIHNGKLLWLFTSRSFQEEFQERLRAVLWIVNGLVTPLLLMGVWLVVGENSQLTLSQSQIVSYFLLTLLVGRVTQSWVIDNLGEMVRNGDFSQQLVRPTYYLLEVTGMDGGGKLIRLLTLFPVFLSLCVVFSKYLVINFSLVTFGLFLLSLLLGSLIRIYLYNFLVLFVFWLEEYWSIDQLNDLFSEALSGGLIPLTLAPVFLQGAIYFSPYRFFVSFPIEIALGLTAGSKLAESFALGTFYLCLFYFLHKITFAKALQKYSAYGH